MSEGCVPFSDAALFWYFKPRQCNPFEAKRNTPSLVFKFINVFFLAVSPNLNPNLPPPERLHYEPLLYTKLG